MTKNAKNLTLLPEVANESLDEYVERKQTELIAFLNRHSKRIDELNFKRLVSEVFDGHTWEEVFNHFHNMYGRIINVLRDNEMQSLKERMVKGAQMIEDEQNEAKRQDYLTHYGRLEKRLKELNEVWQ